MQFKYTYADLIPELTEFISLFTDRDLPYDRASFGGSNTHFNLNAHESDYFMGLKFTGAFNTRALYSELALLHMIDVKSQEKIFWDIQLGVSQLEKNIFCIVRYVFEIGIDERRVRSKTTIREKQIESLKIDLSWALEDTRNPKIVFQFFKYLIYKKINMDELNEEDYLKLVPIVVQHFGLQQAFIDLYKFLGLEDRLIKALKKELRLESMSTDYFLLNTSYMIYNFVKWYTDKCGPLAKVESVDDELNKYPEQETLALPRIGIDLS